MSSNATCLVSGTEHHTQIALRAQNIPKNLVSVIGLEELGVYKYVPQWRMSSIGGVINPMMKLLIFYQHGSRRRITQLDAVLSATPLARNRVGKISDGRVHAMGPHDIPYENVKKSEVRNHFE